MLWLNSSNSCSKSWIQPGSIIFFLNLYLTLKKRGPRNSPWSRAHGPAHLSHCKEKPKSMGGPSSPGSYALLFFWYFKGAPLFFFWKKNAGNMLSSSLDFEHPVVARKSRRYFFCQNKNPTFKSFQPRNTSSTPLKHP
jgi:hypothetical protein